MNAKRQALVIGANGVIGRRLIEELAGQGWHCLLYTSDAADE